MSVENPFAGAHVVLTRDENDAQPWVSYWVGMGARVTVLPCVRFEALKKPVYSADFFKRVGWVVFSSAHAVLYTHQWLEHLGVSWAGHTRFTAVGPSTASCVKGTWLCGVLVPEQHHAEGLLRMMLQNSSVQDGVVLLPSALHGSDVLEKGLKQAGYEVERVALYRTCTEGFAETVVEGVVDWVVFASPSAVHGYVQRGRVCEPKRVASIGPSTTAALVSYGFDVDCEAQEATLESLSEGMKQCM